MSKTATKTQQAAVPETAVTISTKMPKAARGVDTKPYWVGTLPGCPLQNVTAGGITFPGHTGEATNSAGDLIPDRDRSHGIIQHLSDKHVQLIKAGILLRVMRFGAPEREDFENAEGFPKPKRIPRAHIVMRDSKKMNAPGYAYEAQQGDQPLARFVYMHRADRMSMLDTKNNWPPHSMEAPEGAEEQG